MRARGATRRACHHTPRDCRQACMVAVCKGGSTPCKTAAAGSGHGRVGARVAHAPRNSAQGITMTAMPAGDPSAQAAAFICSGVLMRTVDSWWHMGPSYWPSRHLATSAAGASLGARPPGFASASSGCGGGRGVPRRRAPVSLPASASLRAWSAPAWPNDVVGLLETGVGMLDEAGAGEQLRPGQGAGRKRPAPGTRRKRVPTACAS